MIRGRVQSARFSQCADPIFTGYCICMCLPLTSSIVGWTHFCDRCWRKHLGTIRISLWKFLMLQQNSQNLMKELWNIVIFLIWSTSLHLVKDRWRQAWQHVLTPKYSGGRGGRGARCSRRREADVGSWADAASRSGKLDRARSRLYRSQICK